MHWKFLGLNLISNATLAQLISKETDPISAAVRQKQDENVGFIPAGNDMSVDGKGMIYETDDVDTDRQVEIENLEHELSETKNSLKSEESDHSDTYQQLQRAEAALRTVYDHTLEVDPAFKADPSVLEAIGVAMKRVANKIGKPAR